MMQIISELSNASNDYNDLETYLAMLTTERTALLIQIEKLKKEGEDLKRGTTKLKSVSPSLYRKFMSPGTQTSLIMGSTPNIPSQLIHKKLLFIIIIDFLIDHQDISVGVFMSVGKISNQKPVYFFMHL